MTYTQSNKLIYMDHAATTPMGDDVIAAMSPYTSEYFGNPSSLHRCGRKAFEALAQARQTVAQMLGCKQGEVIFTSGGTESDNLAIRGVALGRREHGNHIITSQIEHHAVLHTCAQLEKEYGFRVSYLPVDSYGTVDPKDVARAITPQTTLISIMYANNEVGTIQPISAIGRIAREHGIVFHTDAVQAASALDLDVQRLDVDLMSLSAHKFYGPKGVGILFAREGLRLLPTQTGGGQERQQRGGTENVPGIIGTATALALAHASRPSNIAYVTKLRDRLIQGVLDHVPCAKLTGHPVNRLPNCSSFVFEGVDSESLICGLDEEGICASSSSVCTSRSLETSHVLTAMGYSREMAAGSLRLTLGKDNTATEVDFVLDVLPNLVRRFQALSASYVLAT